jgi:hypothetical protein
LIANEQQLKEHIKQIVDQFNLHTDDDVEGRIESFDMIEYFCNQ